MAIIKNRTCQQRISLTCVPFQVSQYPSYFGYSLHVDVHIPTTESEPSYLQNMFKSQMFLASLLWIPLVLASSPAPPVNQKLAASDLLWFPGFPPWESPSTFNHPKATCNFTKGTRASPAPWSESKMLKIGSQSLVKQRLVMQKNW